MTAWREHAACAAPEHDTELWYPDPGNIIDRRTAIIICRTCPVQTECLDAALEYERPWGSMSSPFGIWGGRTAEERARMLGRSRKLRTS